MLKKVRFCFWSAVLTFSLNLSLASSMPLLAQSSAGRISKCSDCLVMLQIKKCATPQYPLLARSIHLQGTVVVEIEIDAEGTVITAIPISGPPLLWASSVAAALRWEFDPQIIDGKPITIRGILTFRFDLDGREPSDMYRCQTN